MTLLAPAFPEVGRELVRVLAAPAVALKPSTSTEPAATTASLFPVICVTPVISTAHVGVVCTCTPPGSVRCVVGTSTPCGVASG